MVTEIAMTAALTRSASATGSAIMDGNSIDSSTSNTCGDRVRIVTEENIILKRIYNFVKKLHMLCADNFNLFIALSVFFMPEPDR